MYGRNDNIVTAEAYYLLYTVIWILSRHVS